MKTPQQGHKMARKAISLKKNDHKMTLARKVKLMGDFFMNRVQCNFLLNLIIFEPTFMQVQCIRGFKLSWRSSSIKIVDQRFFCRDIVDKS